jgi:hypothetical protein
MIESVKPIAEKNRSGDARLSPVKPNTILWRPPGI